MNIHDYIAHETIRQSGTWDEYVGMKQAHAYLTYMSMVDETVILDLANHINGVRGYREVPAVFNQGVPALPASLIPNAMEVLSDALVLRSINGRGVWSESGFDDALVKEFLDIHPFTDGNGRVASLLWNFLKNTLDDPEPLPYFYGKS